MSTIRIWLYVTTPNFSNISIILSLRWTGAAKRASMVQFYLVIRLPRRAVSPSWGLGASSTHISRSILRISSSESRRRVLLGRSVRRDGKSQSAAFLRRVLVSVQVMVVAALLWHRWTGQRPARKHHDGCAMSRAISRRMAPAWWIRCRKPLPHPTRRGRGDSLGRPAPVQGSAPVATPGVLQSFNPSILTAPSPLRCATSSKSAFVFVPNGMLHTYISSDQVIRYISCHIPSSGMTQASLHVCIMFKFHLNLKWGFVKPSESFLKMTQVKIAPKGSKKMLMLLSENIGQR